MLKQTLLYLPAQLFGPLAMFVAAVVWTHLLDTETYGAVSLVLAAQELVYMLTIAWWSLYALRYRGAVEGERRAKLVASDNAVVFGGALLTWGALRYFAPRARSEAPALTTHEPSAPASVPRAA